MWKGRNWKRMESKPWYSRFDAAALGLEGWPGLRAMKTSTSCVILSSMLLAMVLGSGLLLLQMLTVGPMPPWLPVDLMLGSIGGGGSAAAATSPPVPFRNITGQILDELHRNGTSACHQQNTNSTEVIGFADTTEVITLPTDVVHRFWLESRTLWGTRRCAGGDYYETDLASPLWKSRPPVEDLHNGTYAVSVMVPAAFAGDYNFTADLLFDAYHGLDHHAEYWHILRQTVFLRFRFVAPSLKAASESASRRGADKGDRLSLERCAAGDFGRSEWSGRWSRPRTNDSCGADWEGRYAHCYPDDDVPCKDPSWCDGKLSRLESTGWSYSAHCAFHIFEPEEAWDCLSGRWLFFWGDSNHQDTIRNLLFFALKIPQPQGMMLRDWQLDRNIEAVFMNPLKVHQVIHISSLFNGHHIMNDNGLGLDSMLNDDYRDFLTKHFQGPGGQQPDTIIMNTGLHDGWRFADVPNYVRAVDRAVDYWDALLRNVSGKPPKVVYRTTIAPAGWARGMMSNPWKMEVYNKIITEKVQARLPNVHVVDAFDLSFPWHFGATHSDGGHYGRPPGAQKEPWFDKPHQYYVDVMLVHILLNAICPAPQRPPKPAA